KYPSWINPPDEVSAAIPPIKQITNVNGHVFNSNDFTDRLQLPADQPLPGCSANLEHSPIFDALETRQYDVVLIILCVHRDQPAPVSLTVKVHRGNKVVASVDAGASLAEVEVPLHAVTAATELSVSLTAQSVEPTGLGSDVNVIYIKVAILPRGTYRRASHSLKTWFQELRRYFGGQRD